MRNLSFWSRGSRLSGPSRGNTFYIYKRRLTLENGNSFRENGALYFVLAKIGEICFRSTYVSPVPLLYAPGVDSILTVR